MEVVCYIAVRILLYTGTEAVRALNIRRSAASHAIRRGNEIIAEHPDLLEKILQ